MYVDGAAVVIMVLLAVMALQFAWPLLRRKAAEVRPLTAKAGSARREEAYEWDRRTDQALRRLKGVDGPQEDRDAMAAFLDSHSGVEAFVEPKTVMHPLSVVFVDGDGESRRFELTEDTHLRTLARERAIPILDASKVGYPERMRRRRSSRPEEET